MKLVSWIKGIKKKYEVRKYEPDKDFTFSNEYYGDLNLIEGLNILYTNDYTDNLYDKYTNILSYISCVISLPYEFKTITDLICILDSLYLYKSSHSIYNHHYIKIYKNNIQLYLRGNIEYYKNIVDNNPNNIFTKCIRDHLFVEDNFIITPNQFLNTNYNSIKNPNYAIDILFIDKGNEFLKPVIGLSLNTKTKFPDYSEMNTIISNALNINKRHVIYIQLDKLSANMIEQIIVAKHSNLLIDLLHQNNLDNNYPDIDEIIEESSEG